MTKITIVEPGFTVAPHTINVMRELPKHVERCGRVCYKSEDKITSDSADKFVSKICRNAHESVLEHAALTVFVTCSRACSHQLVRHRIAAYSQESQRYINYNKKGMEIICPPSIGVPTGEYEVDVNGAKINGDFHPEWNWLFAVAMTYDEYKYQIEKGVKPEDARYILPNCMKTE
jgi:thymidylate synthase (FAD)